MFRQIPDELHRRASKTDRARGPGAFRPVRHVSLDSLPQTYCLSLPAQSPELAVVPSSHHRIPSRRPPGAQPSPAQSGPLARRERGIMSGVEGPLEGRVLPAPGNRTIASARARAGPPPSHQRFHPASPPTFPGDDMTPCPLKATADSGRPRTRSGAVQTVPKHLTPGVQRFAPISRRLSPPAPLWLLGGRRSPSR